MKKVTWIVINEDNLEEVRKKLESSGKPFAFYALTGDGYGNLGQNFSDIRALVQQQQAIIAAYENYYTDAEDTMKDAVEE
jgi:nitrogen regulatory protein PII